MVDVYTIAFFLGLGGFFLAWALKQKNYYAGFISALLFLVFGVMFLQTGIGFPSGDLSSVSYNYSNQSINLTNLDSSFVVTSYSLFNSPVVSNKTISTSYLYNTTRDTFTDGLGLIFILTGVMIGFLSVMEILKQRNISSFLQAEAKAEDDAI